MCNLLILLIGSNPLPNYVVAKYLLNEERLDKDDLPKPDKFIFVYSTDTKKFYEKLKGKLGLIEYENCFPVYLGDKERNYETIQKGIKEAIREINLENITSIHLNYTGGTKPMSVHSYNTVMSLENNNKPDIYFSDLDPNIFKLTVLKKVLGTLEFKDSKDYPLEKDLRFYVQLNIKDIITLHNMEILYNGEDSSLFKDSINEVLVKRLEYNNNSDKDNWFNKFADEDRKKPKEVKCLYYNIKNIRKKNKEKSEQLVETEIERKTFAWVSDLNKRNFFRDFTQTFPSTKSFFDQKENYIKNNLYQFWSFFNGCWLEDLILERLKRLKAEEKVSFDEIRKGIEVEYNNKPAEIDLIIIRGYQMFLISITTSSNEGTVKQKIFEAIYRGEQLGGTHCKVISVSLAEDQNKLKSELQQFDAKRNCNLITKNHFKKNTLEDELINLIGKLK